MTQVCKSCIFWSDTVSRSIGGGPVEALCLVDSGPFRGEYTTERQVCSSWESTPLICALSKLHDDKPESV